jgi:hypothetical protein
MEKLYGGYEENSGSGMRAGTSGQNIRRRQGLHGQRIPKLDHLIRATIISGNGA